MSRRSYYAVTCIERRYVWTETASSMYEWRVKEFRVFLNLLGWGELRLATPFVSPYDALAAAVQLDGSRVVRLGEDETWVELDDVDLE